jgi:hypothetical protein
MAPEGYDIEGMSGGPLMMMVDSANLAYWRLGGAAAKRRSQAESGYGAGPRRGVYVALAGRLTAQQT